MEIIRGTTPVFGYDLSDQEGIDFGQITAISLVIAQGSAGTLKIDKDMDDVSIDSEAKTISFRMTQKESLSFEVGKAAAQLKLLMEDNTVLITEAEQIDIKKVLKGEIMS